MIASATPQMRVVIYEGPGAETFSPDDRFALLQALLQRGYAAAVGQSIEEGTAAAFAAVRSSLVVGRFAGKTPDFECEGSKFCDVSGRSADEAADLVEEVARGGEPKPERRWKPWFPVIDFDRCTNCMQCLSFCLFDVYGVTPDGKITVQNESNCKTDCPACSRVCPEVAILFPKYKAGPINGDEVNSDDVRREAMKVDVSALLGGDIYSLLRDRSEKAKSRFSKERDDERALKERQRCLTKLKEGAGLEIPAEVLSSLPSLDQILQKADEAKRRAADAVAENERRAKLDQGDGG